MAPLTTTAAAAARTLVRSTPCCKTAVRAVSSSAALRADSHSSSDTTWSSPFKGEPQTTRVPDFSKYMARNSASSNKVFSYFMVGTMGAITAAGAKSTITGESPSKSCTGLFSPGEKTWRDAGARERRLGDGEEG